MATQPQIPARRATARLRIRGDAPTINSPKVGYIESGMVFEPIELVEGDPVMGNAAWYALGANRFVWSGASAEVGPTATTVPAAGLAVNRRSNGGVEVLKGSERTKVFGEFDFSEVNGGAIKIDPRWVKENITTLETPLLAGTGFSRLWLHEKAIGPFERVFAKIENAGLADSIKTCAGTWVARHMGWDPKRALSSHSWGMAIDLNARWNGYGSRPAALGSIGSVRELVPIFESEGFAWGGYFEPVKFSDGMHFELARTDL